MAEVKASMFGQLPDGRAVSRYALQNAGGTTAEIMNYGAAMIALRTPDNNGRFENVVLGFNTLEPYLASTANLGATIGRYANRIARAHFKLDGREYKLATNDGANTLHGGAIGFDKALWDAEPFSDATSTGVRFSYISPDGEAGFPGALSVEVIYRLTKDDILSIDYRATTTKPTPVNLTHHSYFNLSGDPGRAIGDHELLIEADHFTPVDASVIPTGELRDVADTPFDFRASHAIGARIEDDDAQLRIGGGYDHNFVLNKPAPNALTRAAVLLEPSSGRRMELWTTEPGLQFYTGNSLPARRTGLCLEPQHFPNSPNEPRFPSTILRLGEMYASRTEFRFSVAR
jgi:aldose 1-epimerase